MPVITFMSSKGGAGKTTAVFCLADRALAMGMKVTIIDTDPTDFWRGFQEDSQITGAGLPESLRLVTAFNVAELYEAAKTANETSDLVLIDTKGAIERLAITAGTISDMVIIPLKFSGKDWREAIATYTRLSNVSEEAEYKDLYMDYERIKFLWSETEIAIQSNLTKELRQRAKDSNAPVFTTELYRRTALRAALDKGKLFHQLTPEDASDVSKTVSVANCLMKEIVEEIERINEFLDAKNASSLARGAS
ncbi:ParA family protein [Brucella sp. HL-2]|nr:ParA family protein [Brucella sp. HL-2]MCV9909561.1 ParA family protein [Brucella sp. HL-2]